MIYELETQHNKTRQQYEDDISRLRAELVQTRQAAQAQAQQAQQSQAPGLLSHPSAAGGPGGPPPPPGSIPPPSTSPHVAHAAAVGHPGPAYGETPYAYRPRDDRDMRDARDVRDVRDVRDRDVRDRELRDARDVRGDVRDIRDMRDTKERELRDSQRERELRERDAREAKRIKTERGKSDRLGMFRVMLAKVSACLRLDRLCNLIRIETLPGCRSLWRAWTFRGASANASIWGSFVSWS